MTAVTHPHDCGSAAAIQVFSRASVQFIPDTCCSTCIVRSLVGKTWDLEFAPDSDADESRPRRDESRPLRRDESQQSQAVMTVTGMSRCSHEPDAEKSRLEHMQGTSASAASKPGPPSSRWVSMQGPPTCAEPDAGSSIGPLSSGTCSTPIYPPVRHKLFPYIGQVRKELYDR